MNLSSQSALFHHYQITRTATYVAPWLLFVKYLLSIGVITYFLTDMLIFHRYARFETPEGITSLWLPSYSHLSDGGANDTSFCNNRAYDVPLPVLFTNISCIANPDPGLFTTITQTSLFFTTLHSENTGLEAMKANYVVGASKLRAGVVYGFSSGLYGTTLTPEAYLVYPNKMPRRERVVVDETRSMFISSQQVLDMAGVDLSKPNLPNAIPFRFTGVKVTLNFYCANYWDYQIGVDLHCDITATALPGFWGHFETPSRPSLITPNSTKLVSYLQNGVVAEVKITGRIGTVDGYSIVMSLTGFTVFMGIAGEVTNILFSALQGKRRFQQVQDEEESNQHHEHESMNSETIDVEEEANLPKRIDNGTSKNPLSKIEDRSVGIVYIDTEPVVGQNE